MMRLSKLLNLFPRLVVLVLIVLMMAVVAIATVELAVVIVREMLRAPNFELDIDQIFTIFGFFMMVLIGLELLESIRNYLSDELLHVEVVFLVALIAVARKVIILDVKTVEPLAAFGIAAIVFSLAAGYYLVKRAISRDGAPGLRGGRTG